jgi:hypothetical protein
MIVNEKVGGEEMRRERSSLSARPLVSDKT